jgi:hypothetical protein
MRTKERREQKLDIDGGEESTELEQEGAHPTSGKPALEANIDRHANEHSGEDR